MHLVLFGERSQIAKEDLGRQNMRRTDNYLPILGAGRYLIGTSHFRIACAANNEHYDTRYILDGRLRLVLVPVTVSRTATMSKERCNGLI